MATPVELYLIRHGAAAPRGEAFPDDRVRPLTERGMANLRKEGRGLARLDVAFDVILTSPLTRAAQTAELIAAELPAHPPIETLDALAPGEPVAALLKDLASNPRGRRIALVGHEPAISELAGRLIGLRQPLAFKKGAVCRIDFAGAVAPSAGTLRWFLTPGLLRKLRK